MSQIAEPTVSVVASDLSPENSTASPVITRTLPSDLHAAKPRSCIICRKRKVRCDKQSPCSNCSRAKIACVFPTADRSPRWARRLERLNINASASDTTSAQGPVPGTREFMERLRTLENLVKELSLQLEQAHALGTISSAAGGSSGVNSPGRSAPDPDVEDQKDASHSGTRPGTVQSQFGRLVPQAANSSRYISSGFWSRVDELAINARGLAGDDTDSSEDEDPLQENNFPTQELNRTPFDRHAFLWGHQLGPAVHDLHQFHPLPSQIPFLLDLFSDNVNFIMQIVHMPTVTKMIRGARGNFVEALTPANEALMFSIYYATITSMEEDDVVRNFAATKSDLNLKFRLGFEYALAKADFLNSPDLVIVQACGIFLCLVRRHDSPRYVWMMTGLVIRMAQYLGLQRDGSNFEHLKPFEIEMRRRVWWAVCNLDLRASEDQGTDLAITAGGFDTKIPLNINDADINPESKEMPTERDGLTDMSLTRIQIGLYLITRQLMGPGAGDPDASLEYKSGLLSEVYGKYEEGYLRHTTESTNIPYWVTVSIVRLVMAKLTLIVFLPVLFSSPSEHFSDEIRNKLLVSAIEVAEFNHVLNSEQASRPWRWIYQTYTHWHAILYLMIEISRRPWSSIVERGWVALHSSWLIPAKPSNEKNLRIWLPLRKLMANAFRHRNAELTRLRADPAAAARLDLEDQKQPLPSSPGPLSTAPNADFRERWWRLVAKPDEAVDPAFSPVGTSRKPLNSIPEGMHDQVRTAARPGIAYHSADGESSISFEPLSQSHNRLQSDLELGTVNVKDLDNMVTVRDYASHDQTAGTWSYNPIAPIAFGAWPEGHAMAPGFVPWYWANMEQPSVSASGLEFDPNDVQMNMNGDVDWYNWVEAAQGSELNTNHPGPEQI